MSLGQDCLLQLEWGRGRLRTGSPGSEHTVGRVAGIFQHQSLEDSAGIACRGKQEVHTLGEPSSQSTLPARCDGSAVEGSCWERGQGKEGSSRLEEGRRPHPFLLPLWTGGRGRSQRQEAGSGVERPKGKLSSEGGRRVFHSWLQE